LLLSLDVYSRFVVAVLVARVLVVSTPEPDDTAGSMDDERLVSATELIDALELNPDTKELVDTEEPVDA
jgi:hypothetical protein